jgi:hypothetical protein
MAHMFGLILTFPKVTPPCPPTGLVHRPSLRIFWLEASDPLAHNGALPTPLFWSVAIFLPVGGLQGWGKRVGIYQQSIAMPPMLSSYRPLQGQVPEWCELRVINRQSGLGSVMIYHLMARVGVLLRVALFFQKKKEKKFKMMCKASRAGFFLNFTMLAF